MRFCLSATRVSYESIYNIATNLNADDRRELALLETIAANADCMKHFSILLLPTKHDLENDGSCEGPHLQIETVSSLPRTFMNHHFITF